MGKRSEAEASHIMNSLLGAIALTVVFIIICLGIIVAIGTGEAILIGGLAAGLGAIPVGLVAWYYLLKRRNFDDMGIDYSVP